MNSDAILKQLNRLANDRQLTPNQRSIASQAIQHIRLQDEDIDKLRDDVSHWRNPDGNEPPPAAA